MLNVLSTEKWQVMAPANVLEKWLRIIGLCGLGERRQRMVWSELIWC